MIPQPDFHPNMVPVECETIDDVRALATEMRIAAKADPDVKVEYAASKAADGKPDVALAEKKSKPIAEEMLESGILRFVSYKGRMPVNVCFTLRVEEGFSEWNLSISHATLEGPVRVRDELAAVIVSSFLGTNFEEVPPKAVWDTVRHFIQKCDAP